jgi:hypothetical protein
MEERRSGELVGVISAFLVVVLRFIDAISSSGLGPPWVEVALVILMLLSVFGSRAGTVNNCR